jgi:hypothetical protein
MMAQIMRRRSAEKRNKFSNKQCCYAIQMAAIKWEQEV